MRGKRHFAAMIRLSTTLCLQWWYLMEALAWFEAPLHEAPITHSHHLPPQKPKCGQRHPFPRQVTSFDGRHRIMWHGLFGADQPIGVGAHLLVAPVSVVQCGGSGSENLGHAAFAPHGCHNGPERILIPATDWRKRHHA